MPDHRTWAGVIPTQSAAFLRGRAIVRGEPIDPLLMKQITNSLATHWHDGSGPRRPEDIVEVLRGSFDVDALTVTATRAIENAGLQHAMRLRMFEELW